jgi:hypothetical protein
MDKARGDCFATAAPDEMIRARTQSSRLAEFGGLGMSFNICRGTLGSNVQRDEERLVAGPAECSPA